MKNSLRKRKTKLDMLKSFRKKSHILEKKEVDNPLFYQCKNCKTKFSVNDMNTNMYVCPNCNRHFYFSSMERVDTLLDEGYIRLKPTKTLENPLDFEGYTEKLNFLREDTNLKGAVSSYHGSIDGNPLVLSVMDSRFLMGSMGSAVGEEITYVFEYAKENSLPVVIFCASGGARMQEGMYSLMQMVKTSAAVKRHSEASLLYISYLTNPTTGGVTASFAYLADIILAEPNALIGFAGPRVIKQTMKKALPDGFQRAEFLLEKGFIDKIVSRRDMKKTLSFLLSIHRR
ncbi:MAG: acetyl-CoA carboxylase carboxyl transferase subunit beta [Clostridiales bacterium]|nr:MAG: acetyl-CoA carboxylase carboxyl transferase subunit beta [Clostridiales bacterium]